MKATTMRRGLRSAAATATCAALAALAVSACGSSGSASGSGSGGALTVGVPPVLSGVDVYTAQQQGFFARHHLKVTIKELNGGAAIVPAMQSGAVQIGETNVVSAIQGASHGVDEPCFSGANTDPTSGAYLSLVGAKGITSPAALKGKTIAVNAVAGVNQLLVSAYLSSHGVDPSSVHFISLQYPDMPGALASGRIDAAVTSEPFTTISRGRGAVLLDPTPLKSIQGTPTYSCWNASASWLKSHASQARAFAAAMKQTDAWIAAHQAAFRKQAGSHLTISAAVLPKVTLPVFTDALSRNDIAAWETAAKRYGLIKSPPPSDRVLWSS